MRERKEVIRERGSMWLQNLHHHQKWCFLLIILVSAPVVSSYRGGQPRRLLLDTDVDTDDFFALLYLLKLNRSEFELKGITINSNAWSNAGHAVNHIYDILFMMGRDDIQVGVGGEGGILPNGTILPDVGGYLPLIDQGMSTSGYCRYRQAIPVGKRGRLDIDTSFGVRKTFLPQGNRRYIPLKQPTVQQVMIDTISKGPTTVFLLGSHTNFAIFLMTNPHLKNNVEHVYAMGGGIRSNNPDCCPLNSTSSCEPLQCGDTGNIFTAYESNPYAEFNMFGDPFAAYQVLHSGIPVTLVPLDATNTVPISKKFLGQLEKNQRTYEAQYCFNSLKMSHDTWFTDQFYKSYFMWDSFTVAIAISIMRKPNNPDGQNDFSYMQHMNITIITSNPPYGISDGSNPFFVSNNAVPRFGLDKRGVHSGHVQMGLRDPFCFNENGKGRCQDGYTKETKDPGAVRLLVANKAKPSKNPNGEFESEFTKNFLDVMNQPHQSGRYNISTQFPYYKESYFRPDFRTRFNNNNAKPIIFDMDMSAGDFLTLFYLLKLPRQHFNLVAIFVTPTGWATAATIDVVYDLLHMMNRDDIPVGLGEFLAVNQSTASGFGEGDCKYAKAIPHGGGGFLDSDTLYGLARSLPRSPRRYTAENSVRFGAPRETAHPQFRQPLCPEIWHKLTRKKYRQSKFIILTNGPLTSLANILTSDENATSFIQDVYVVGGNVKCDDTTDGRGNVFTIPSNTRAEFNMFLDPLAAKTVFDSGVNITLIPLGTQRKISTSFSMILNALNKTRKTPEVLFSQRLLSRLQRLQKQHFRYQHMDIFLGEILGAVTMASDPSFLNPTFSVQPITVTATGDESTDGQTEINRNCGKSIRVLDGVRKKTAYYRLFAKQLGNKKQSAVLGSFSLQKKQWSSPRRCPP